MATHCIFLKKCQCLDCSNSYSICPCVKCVKIGCLLSVFQKKKQNKKCENVVVK